MPVFFQNFIGEAPKIEPSRLPEGAAVFAKNVSFDSGALEPLRKMTAVSATLKTGVIRSLFLYERSEWFNWNEVINAINSPIANDSYKRVYFTGDGAPKVTSNLIATGGSEIPTNDYDLGVPSPSEAISASIISMLDDGDFSNDENRYYWMTYVTEYGEEGSYGPQSNVVVITDPTQVVTLQLPVIAVNTFNITHKRIYRGETTGDGTYANFVAEVPLAQTVYTDSIESVSSPIETSGFIPPPDGMRGMTLGSNGMVAGFDGNELIVSEPYLPYAYPSGYRRTVEYSIVAIAATNAGFVVATEGFPYLFAGPAPDSLSEYKLNRRQSCVSARSLVNMGNTAIYASPDGLVTISETSVNVVTEKLISKQDWDLFKPETIHAYAYEDQYIAFYGDENGNGDGIGGFIFDMRTGDFSRISTYATAGYSDILTDTLYLVVREGSQNNLYSWGTSVDDEIYMFKTGERRTPLTSFMYCRVFTDQPRKIGVTVYADGIPIIKTASMQDEFIKLPAVMARKWQVEVKGKASVTRIGFGHSLGELS